MHLTLNLGASYKTDLFVISLMGWGELRTGGWELTALCTPLLLVSIPSLVVGSPLNLQVLFLSPFLQCSQPCGKMGKQLQLQPTSWGTKTSYNEWFGCETGQCSDSYQLHPEVFEQDAASSQGHNVKRESCYLSSEKYRICVDLCWI